MERRRRVRRVASLRVGRKRDVDGADEGETDGLIFDAKNSKLDVEAPAPREEGVDVRLAVVDAGRVLPRLLRIAGDEVRGNGEADGQALERRPTDEEDAVELLVDEPARIAI